MVTHDVFSASYCSRILFLRDGKIFNEIRRGTRERKEFFQEILDVVTLLGGDVSMLSKLAVRNAKRSARDYLIYLVTVTFSLSMVYAFNLIVFSSEIRNLSYGMSAMTGTIIFISLIIVFSSSAGLSVI